ncbi:Transducin family protein / WD-40 repeat family protein [Raphanus sativus]|uniref:Protein TORMOZ EMBRYO DEFECTIVE n=1 Tax=Raphanus sativus TaxID=3726 RepID=A0A6J0MI25_RAPSA|nr:protein TORMOZ EMBRYO DEFECTIVE [Raphanus sativus]KAJ4912191.1 Transducin family protein / WD-40 repeat family protein [Raphanus sativus]
MAPQSLKKNYRCSRSLKQFYGGGPFVVSSDGSFIVCACGDAINIVDASDSSVKSTIEGESDALTALALSPDDKLLFSAGHSRQIRVWDLETSKCIRTWKGHEGPVMGMACHASGGLLATAGSDRKVLVWDVDGGFCTHYFKGHKGVVSSVLFHPDLNKNVLISGSDDATVRVWDLMAKNTEKKCLAILDKHFSAVSSIALSEDGLTLLSAGRDKVVNVWDLQDYSCKTTVATYEVLEAVTTVSSGSPFASFVASLDQKSKKKKTPSQETYFITLGERGVVRIWKSEGSVCLYEQKSSDITVSSDDEESKRGFTAAAMLPSDLGLLCVTADQQFFVYSVVENVEESELVLSKRLVGYNEEISDMKFLGDEEQFLAVATNLEEVRVYDVATMSCSYVLAGHKEVVLSLDTCVSSSGNVLVVTGSKDKTVRLWNATSQSCIGVGTGHNGDVLAVAFAKKSVSFFVSGSGDRTLKVWSIDGISEDSEEPINLKTRSVVAAHDKDINSVAIARNDSLVCTGSEDRTASIWRLPDLVHVVTLKGHKRRIFSVEFSPVDQCVMTASGDKTVKIWAISDGSCLKTFEGHTSSVLRASFITDGTQFVSCGADGLLKLWNVNTSECIATYDQHEDKVWSLAVGKKTEMVATGGGDAVINLWHDSTASDKEDEFRKEEETILRGQELENAVLDAEYTKAIRLAFELRRPHKVYELFAGLCKKRESDEQIVKALQGLEKEEFRLLFEYLREWNTRPNRCHIAQFVLYQTFNILPPTEIVQVKGIGELLEGLIPYSQRHFNRMDRFVRSSFLLDYTLGEMSVIDPESETEYPKDKKIEEEIIASVSLIEQETDQKTPSRKRKSQKSKDRSNKKRLVAEAQGNVIAV